MTLESMPGAGAPLDPSRLHPSIALAPYVEALVVGRRVAVIGQGVAWFVAGREGMALRRAAPAVTRSAHLIVGLIIGLDGGGIGHMLRTGTVAIFAADAKLLERPAGRGRDQGVGHGNPSRIKHGGRVSNLQPGDMAEAA